MSGIVIGKEYPTHHCENCKKDFKSYEADPKLTEKDVQEFEEWGHQEDFVRVGAIICPDCVLGMFFLKEDLKEMQKLNDSNAKDKNVSFYKDGDKIRFKEK